MWNTSLLGKEIIGEPFDYLPIPEARYDFILNPAIITETPIHPIQLTAYNIADQIFKINSLIL